MLAFGVGVVSATTAGWLWGRVTKSKSDGRGATSYVSTPHPDWLPPSKQPHPFSSDTYLDIDPSKTDKASVYSLCISAVVPRPVAFVSSLSAEGLPNLSPYSYFNIMGHNPPVVVVGVCRSPSRGGAKKDTLANIEETGEFVINIISDWFVEAANHTCGEYDRGVDEWQLSGLTPVPAVKVKPARVKESAVHFECKLKQVIEMNDSSGKPSQALVVGEVVLFHVHEGVATKSPTGKLVVDPVALRPVSRLGGVTYGRLTELYDIARPNKDGTYPSHSPTPAAGAGGGANKAAPAASK